MTARLRRFAVAIGAGSWLLAGTAQAAGGDCRTVRVYTAHCFQLAQPHAGCAPIPYGAAPCFEARGTVGPSNGAPALRLKVAGSRHVLGVFGGDGREDNDTLLPPDIRDEMTPSTPGSLLSVRGVFQVCPLAAAQAGWMRPVCIARATHLSLTQPRADYDPPPTPVGEQE